MRNRFVIIALLAVLCYNYRQVIEMNDIIVIGGGPAGMMAAISAASMGAKVALIEKNNILGKKLLITGKGRCNVTNRCDEQTLLANVAHNPKFLYSAFYGFNANDTISFFENAGVELKTERGNRVFPLSDRSSDIRDALKKCMSEYNISILYDTANSLESLTNEVCIHCKKHDYYAQKCIVATGGLSYPETGSTGDGYKFAKDLGHSIVATQPSLIGLKCKEYFCKNLSGLTLKNIAIRLEDNAKTIYEDFGELLFTHVGVSGPTVLSASAHIENPSNTVLFIDLKPALSDEVLDKRILRDLKENNNKDILNALEGLLPKKLLPIVLQAANVPCSVKANSFTKEQRSRLVFTLKNFALHITEKEGIEKAIITRGGVCTNEISPKDMKSKFSDNIYFAGEVLDVDAYTGGFNLQIAFSTGYLAGMSAAKGVLYND